jgi:hypothetical protein
MKNYIHRNIYYIFIFFLLLIFFILEFRTLKIAFNTSITSPVDFPQEYIGGKQLLSGKSLYNWDYKVVFKEFKIPQDSNKINAHPPFAAILLLPLSLLSYQHAIFVWSLLTIFFMFVTTFFLLKAENISLKYFPLMILFVFGWWPFKDNLALGQIDILLLLFVVLAYFFLNKNEILSGVFIALATMLKFYPGLLILYFLVTKKYKAFMSAVVVIFIIFLVTLIITHNDWFILFFKIIPKDVKNFQASPWVISINGFLTRCFLFIKNKKIAFLFENFLYYSSALILMLMTFSIGKNKLRNNLGFSIFVILSLLLSPLTFEYSLNLLLLPSLILLKEFLNKKNLKGIILFMIASICAYGMYYSILERFYFITHRHFNSLPSTFIEAISVYGMQTYGILFLFFLNYKLLKEHIESN